MENNKEKDRIISDLDFYLILINIGLTLLLLFLGVDLEIVSVVTLTFYIASFYIIMKLNK
jgi:hypothetical protein